MAINKVVYDNQTLIDLTDSTLTSSDELVEGVIAYDRSGNRITGTADYMDKVDNPTANRVLIDDGNGQAIDSSVLISNVATQSDLSDYVAKTGDTMTGRLLMVNDSQIASRTDEDFSTTPSSNYYSQGIRFFDTNGGQYGVVQLVNLTNGNKGLAIAGRRIINGTTHTNYLRLMVNDSGNMVVQVDDAAKSAWLSAIGAQGELTAGNGIVISGNTIINRFTNLSDVDLNTIRYNCQAYAGDSCTNKPTANGGMFICTMGSNNGTYGVQLFITYATTNQGVYYRRFNGSATPTAWVKLIKASGDTMTGQLTMDGAWIKNTVSNIDQTVNPTSNAWGQGIQFRDKNNVALASIQPVKYTSGKQNFYLACSKTINGTVYTNGVGFVVNTSGDAEITLYGNNTPSAWRSAIGAQATLVSGTNIKTINNTSLLGSGNLTPANIGAAPLYDGQINYPIGNGTNYVAIRRGGSTSSSSAYVGFFTYKKSDDSYINKLETLVNSNGTRNFAVLSDLTYNSDDTFTISGNYQIFACYIYAPTDYNNVRFFIPTDKPINASTVTCNKLTMTLQTAKNAQGAFLINNINVKATSGYKITCTARGSGIYVDLKCPSTISLTNRDTGTVILGSSTFTFK